MDDFLQLAATIYIERSATDWPAMTADLKSEAVPKVAERLRLIARIADDAADYLENWAKTNSNAA